ncbi:MAG: hypothetical protein RL757_2483 [Bacteroidota bacterium]
MLLLRSILGKMMKNNIWKWAKQTPVFLALFAVWLVWLGIYQLQHAQLDAIFWVSGHRSNFGDTFFEIATFMGESGPFFAFFGLFWFQKRYRLMWSISIVGFSVLAFSGILKPFFSHSRPMAVLRELKLSTTINFVKGVELWDGNGSFPSGHTIGGFALYAFLAFTVFRSRGQQFLLFSMAALVGLSRIYLCQHFPKDVFVGSIIGVILAMFIKKIFTERPLKQ